MRGEFYDRMCDLKACADIFIADLYYHKTCFSNQIRKLKNSKIEVEANNFRITEQKIFEKYLQLIRNILENGQAISLSDIRQ